MTDHRHIFRWDLDKTYLRTDFSSFRAMLKTAFEGAEKKQNVPGTAALLREIKAGGAHGIYFISGSPREMRKVLERKLEMDGVEIDGLILKPNLQNLLRGRFRALREQIGYKLPALLEGRASAPPGVPETLFGDDAEADAFVYSLYADLLGGRVDVALVKKVLEGAGAYPDVIERTLELASKVRADDPVRRIFIHLDGRSPPARFERYGRRVVPIYNYFQVAVVLFADGVLGSGAVTRVAREMVEKYGYQVGELANSLQDLVRRGFLRRMVLPAIAEAVLATGDVAFPSLPFFPAQRIIATFAERIRALGTPKEGEPGPDSPIDYLHALDEDVVSRRAHEKEAAKQERKNR